MKSLDSREKLNSILQKYISSTSPKNRDLIETEIKHDGKIPIIDYLNICFGVLSVDKMSDAEIFWLATAVFRVNSRLGKIDDFFEPLEKENYKYYEKYDGKAVKFPLVFKNVCKLAENQYMFPLTVQEIKDLKAANILKIVPELQRNAKKDKYGDLKTKVDKPTAQEISDLITDGRFFYNGIRFNLMDDGEAVPPEYDENKHTLKVFEGGTIMVPDGNHRTIGCELAKSHLQDSFGVFFTYLPATTIRMMLNQEWTTVPIPKSHKDAMKPTIQNNIVNGILRSPDIDDVYIGNIVKDFNEIKSNNGFIVFTELAEAIKRNYNLKEYETKADQNELRDWIINFMNQVAKLKHSEFTDFATTKRKEWSVSPYAWYYYIMVSRVLRQRENWREDLSKIFSKVDFTDENVRKSFHSKNQRKINEWLAEQEEQICTMLS